MTVRRGHALAALLMASCGRVGFDMAASSDATSADRDASTADGAPGATTLNTVDCAANGAPPICNGLVSLLHFDNKAAFGETAMLVHDFSGLGNDAACTPPNCPTWDPGGKFGGAFSYAEPDAFSIANGPSVSITGAVTMSAWFYPNSLNTAWRIIITKIQPAPLVANYGIPHNGSQLCVNFCTTNGGWMNHCSPAGFSPGRWYHLVGVIDNASSRARLYVDGALVVDDAETTPMERDTGAVWIGWSPTNAGVDGRIDEVAIWNRALSAAEIAALYP